MYFCQRFRHKNIRTDFKIKNYVYMYLCLKTKKNMSLCTYV